MSDKWVRVDIHDLQKEEDERREKVLGEVKLRVCYLQEKVEKAVQRSEEKYCAV